MNKILACIIFLNFVIQTNETFSQMTIQVVSVPQLTPMLDDIYLTGSFNNWDPSDENFRLTHTGNIWSISVNGTNGDVIEFKFTRGVNWLTVEGTNLGAVMGNRTATYQEGTILSLEIAGWEDIAGNHSVSENVRILDGDFAMPELNRSRRIWILFPENYNETTDDYPVFYMHDGQNLFDGATSFSGEWSVDENVLAAAVQGCTETIVVGIDNGGEHRIDEYSPWINTEYNEGGEGIAYANFIVQTLKPFIDSNFRTLSDRSNTSVGGSSLGALISMYMLEAHSEIFSKAAILSPAFWFNSEIYSYVENNTLPSDSHIYFVCGDNESTGMVPDMQQMYNTVLNEGISSDNLDFVVQPNGTHNEYWWSQYFPAMYSSLFDCSTSVVELASGHVLQIFPNPAHDTITLSMNKGIITQATIIDSKGTVVAIKNMLNEKTIEIGKLPSGFYTVNCSFMPEFTSTVVTVSTSFIKE